MKDNSSIRFVTVFPLATNIHLVKDVGQIPLFLSKKKQFTSKLVAYKCSENTYLARNLKEFTGIIDSSYSYLQSEAKGLEIEFIKDKGQTKNYEKAVLMYLIWNSKKIDVLNLYHFNNKTFLYSWVYKMFNRKGKVYIKTDFNPNNIEDIIQNLSKALIKYSKPIKFIKDILLLRKLFFSEYLLKQYLKKIDLISFETDYAKIIFDKYNLCPNAKKIVLPNGFNHLAFSNIKKRTFQGKENIFLTIGRLGTKQKNTYSVLDILPNINLKNWKFIFAGSLTKDLEKYVFKYFKVYPFLKGKVIFTGEIKDRNEVIELYNKSKVFFLTSLWEGFPLVLPEAVYYRNYLLLSNKIIASEMFLNKNKGDVFSIGDTSDLQQKIEGIINMKTDIGDSINTGDNNFGDYTWVKIIDILHNEIISLNK